MLCSMSTGNQMYDCFLFEWLCLKLTAMFDHYCGYIKAIDEKHELGSRNKTFSHSFFNPLTESKTFASLWLAGRHSDSIFLSAIRQSLRVLEGHCMAILLIGWLSQLIHFFFSGDPEYRNTRFWDIIVLRLWLSILICKWRGEGRIAYLSMFSARYLSRSVCLSVCYHS